MVIYLAMQSEQLADPSLRQRPWPKWSGHWFPLAVFGVLPAIGFGAELLFGMLSTVLTLFPQTHRQGMDRRPA